MMTLQAKVLTKETTAVGGETIELSQLSDAVDEYNSSKLNNLVTMEEWPGARRLDLDRVAGSAILHIENDRDVIATIKLMDTPMGEIAKQLNEANARIYLRPVAAVIPSKKHGRRLKIERLVIVTNPASPMFDSPLKVVQDWVSGEVHTPMYQIKDK